MFTRGFFCRGGLSAVSRSRMADASTYYPPPGYENNSEKHRREQPRHGCYARLLHRDREKPAGAQPRCLRSSFLPSFFFPSFAPTAGVYPRSWRTPLGISGALSLLDRESLDRRIDAISRPRREKGDSLVVFPLLPLLEARSMMHRAMTHRAVRRISRVSGAPAPP